MALLGTYNYNMCVCVCNSVLNSSRSEESFSTKPDSKLESKKINTFKMQIKDLKTFGSSQKSFETNVDTLNPGNGPLYVATT
jgi:hypothetical protein